MRSPLVPVTLLALAIAAAACGRSAPAPAATAGGEMSRAVVDPYLAINAALASDSMDGVTANAGAVATGASAFGAPAAGIDTAAVQLASATGLDDARVKLAVLSEAIDGYMGRQLLHPPKGVRTAFCPMVLKPWMQKDGAIRNPYYGSRMLTCGAFTN